MTKQRQLSEDEQKARAKRKGMTRREYNRKHSKFAGRVSSARSGSFEVAAVYEGNPVPQTVPFPNELAALARFDVLRSNSNLLSVKVIENKVRYDASGKANGLRQETLYSFVRGGPQEFANSKYETLWGREGGNTTYRYKNIKASPKLLEAFSQGEFKVVKQIAYDGSPWWERRQ